MKFAVPIAVDDRPHPVDVVGHLSIYAKFIALGAAISKGSDAENGPRMVGLGGIPAEKWTSRVPSTSVDASTSMSGAEHVLIISIK